MNFRLLSKQLGMVALLIGGTMLFSLPWAFPALGTRWGITGGAAFEAGGFAALSASVVICGLIGGGLLWMGRRSQGRLFRKEAMAVVGLSWLMATVLGAMPFYFSGTYRCSSVRLMQRDENPYVYDFGGIDWRQWRVQSALTDDQFDLLTVLIEARAKGLNPKHLKTKFEKRRNQRRTPPNDEDPQPEAGKILEQLAASGARWKKSLIFPRQELAPDDRRDHYRIRWIKMGLVDSLFESQSGFSTTGATVISELEDPAIVPHCILFWRSSTHFLGGLGIIVLFVVILGQGSAGKALMRAEMPGPTKEGATARMQDTAWLFAAIYGALNVVLAMILWMQGLTAFDAFCHAFGTMATGGFSTYNDSLGHFQSAAIEYTVVVFMILAGTNFTLLYLLLLRRPGKLLADVEWRTYMRIIVGVTALVVVIGLAHGDFTGQTLLERIANSIRYGLFQVVSIVTTTGYGTHDFDDWNSFGRGVLFLLMFVGGCAGSTGGGMKVIRHILFLKIMWLEIEQAFHPRVIRPLKLGGRPADDPDLRKNILVYFGLILVIFVFSWMAIVTIEPDATWGNNIEHKLIDSASGVAATLNNIGPGLGTVGATQNYSHFSPLSKILFVWLMMIGRLEIFSILVLFVPAFWRSR